VPTAGQSDDLNNCGSQARQNMVFLNHDLRFANCGVAAYCSRPGVSGGGRLVGLATITKRSLITMRTKRAKVKVQTQRTSELGSLDHIVRALLSITFCLGLTACQPGRDAEVRKFWRDYTKSTTSVCELHHAQMTREKVSVRGYGLIPVYFQSPYRHAPRDADSGCLSPAEPSYAFVWVCPECRKGWEAAGRPD